MSSRVRWINVDGVRCLYEDFSNLRENDFVRELQEGEKALLAENSKVIFTLSNFTNSYMNNDVKKQSDQLMENVSKQGKKLISATFGISGLQRIIANAVKKDVYFAKSEADAKSWIVENAKRNREAI